MCLFAKYISYIISYNPDAILQVLGVTVPKL